MIWLAFAMLVLAAIIVVLPPLLKSARATAAEANDLAVYRDQLKEIDGDVARGTISTGEAEAARTEIKRRILALAASPAGDVRTSGPLRVLAIGVAAGVTLVSLGLYVSLGRPGLPGKPYDGAAERQAMQDGMLREVETMVAKLAARLKTQPGDAKGWRMLGWSYLQLGRPQDGVDALKHAVALDPENAALRSQLGEGLVQLAGGDVSADAMAVFDDALKRDAKEPRARFYKGLAMIQAGKEREAFALWVAILQDGPADAEWMPGLREQAQLLAAKLKLDPSAVP